MGDLGLQPSHPLSAAKSDGREEPEQQHLERVHRQLDYHASLPSQGHYDFV